MAAQAKEEAATVGDKQESGFTVPKLSRGCTRKRDSSRSADSKLSTCARELFQLRKKRTKQELSCQELRSILHRVIQDRENHRDVALMFNVKPALIRNLVRNEKFGRNQV